MSAGYPTPPPTPVATSLIRVVKQLHGLPDRHELFSLIDRLEDPRA